MIAPQIAITPMSKGTPPEAGWPHDEPPFHAGEQAMQTRAGVGDIVGHMGRKIIRGAMPDQHRKLFEQLPFILIGALDGERRPWAAIVVGGPGFVSSPDSRTLVIGALPDADDPVRAALRPGASVGILGIELMTRRRNRANGVVAEISDSSFTVLVEQSFGNCPKYIQARAPIFVDAAAQRGAPIELRERLSADAVALVRATDTFFIATATPDAADPHRAASGGSDISHRGGKPGFVRVTEEDGRTILTVPDFVGNFMFNTFGNLAVNPRAGLLFLDFGTGDLLQLTGRAEVIFEGSELEAFEGAERLLRFQLEAGRGRPSAMPLRAASVEFAPQLEALGSWERVDER
jgi:predicted pyridoxine 5'-phosphate oxidase superfamily flavin-nucleotide-binding protein